MKNILYSLICFLIVNFKNGSINDQENLTGIYYQLKNYYEYSLELQDDNFFFYYEAEFSDWKESGKYTYGKWLLKNDTLILNSQEPIKDYDTTAMKWFVVKDKLFKVKKSKLIEIGNSKRKLKKKTIV